ncbi:MAG TPA: hypothetical protein VNW90_21735 [Acetobacteraceae bacterium]|jgi:hypothetical protein|nr:hypothetical protein [Acetobacteraceae bacterium]
MCAGNVYRHNYDNIAENKLWHTVNHSLGELIMAMEQELEASTN